MNRLVATLLLVRDVVRHHGGGWTGVRAVASRCLRTLRTLGWKGLIGRVRVARQPLLRSLASPDAVAFPLASSLDQVRFSVGIMVHAFYTDLLDELAAALAHMPVPYVLMVSVVDPQAATMMTKGLANLPNMNALHVRVVPNRGRDIAPFLVDFRDEILALDLVCHIHTKKSLYAGGEQDRWRRYLFDALLGNRGRIAWILGMFHAMPTLGMVYPETFAAAPWWAHTWLSNLDRARELGARLRLNIDPFAYIDYPLGSMFWARTETLRPLFALGLSHGDFPPEQGQTDGTTQHAVERLLGQLPRQQGQVLGILPADGSAALRSEGERNWTAYFNATPAQRIELAAVDAQMVSFDLFDTLVTRPFLHPSGARAYLAHLVAQTFGVADFAALRSRAEALARAKSNHDVDTTAIYAAMARLPELRDHDAAAIREFELAIEARLLKPRRALLDAARAQTKVGRRVVAVSDMYMNATELRHVLPTPVSDVLQDIHVSCDTNWRKDSGEAWRQLPSREGIAPARWLHVGDNEHADVQLPLALGFIGPVHAMRPGALFDAVPALRPLRPTPDLLDRWQDQLWLGLVANHFGALADLRPELFVRQLIIETPETFGYVVLGPLLLDYCTWLARQALEGGVRRVLFLSREGYLLLRAFRRLQQADPSLAALEAAYLLVSRRAVNTPSLHTLEDLAPILAAPYTGPMNTLLRARLGDRVAEAVTRQLGSATIAGEVYLPEMVESLIEQLRPAAAAILDIAREERAAYLAYWFTQTGGEDAIVADIGYAATIQGRLAGITGTPLRGAYFALRQAAVQVGHNRAAARFHDGRRDDAATSPVMQHHLLLEAMLTSPDGQFSHFRQDASGLMAMHFPNPRDKTAWALIERIQAGALHFIDDACEVADPNAAVLTFDAVHVQRPLHCVGVGHWRLGNWAKSLHVEDHYTGRGEVNVANIPGA